MARLLLALTAALLLAPLLALMLVLQRSPSVARDGPTVDATGRSLAALRAQDPRHLPSGSAAALVLRTADLEQLLDRASARLGPMAWRVQLDAGQARMQLSMDLGRSTVPLWLNVDATFRQTEALPALQRWQLGALPLPAWAGTWLLQRLAAQLDQGLEARLTRDLVRRVEFRPGEVRVAYTWRGDLGARLGAALLPPGDVPRLKAYAERLAALGPELPPGEGVSLARLLPPMFALARQRSAAGEDAKRENRAAVLALVVMAEGRRYASLSPAASAWPDPPRREVLLAGRPDLPRHFLIAALLTIDGGERLADAMSLAKEVDDARFGSGFSFNDLAAGRAGARFAVLATDAPRPLQTVVARGVDEHDLLPEVDDLPEFMALPAFRRRFGEIGSPTYRAMMALIELRLDALPLAGRVAAAADGAPTR